MEVRLDALEVGDDPDAWASAGFRVVDGEVGVGGVRIRCLGDGAGHDRWRLDVEGGIGVPPSVDGITTSSYTGDPLPPIEHPNRVVAFDHVVLRTPDLDRTTDALGALGLELRRTRDVGGDAATFQQRFFRAGAAILELVGPAAPEGDGPCRIWGYALITEDIDASAALLGDRCSPPKDAVQPGRRIATVRTTELGIGPALALMTPHVRTGR